MGFELLLFVCKYGNDINMAFVGGFAGIVNNLYSRIVANVNFGTEETMSSFSNNWSFDIGQRGATTHDDMAIVSLQRSNAWKAKVHGRQKSRRLGFFLYDTN